MFEPRDHNRLDNPTKHKPALYRNTFGGQYESFQFNAHYYVHHPVKSRVGYPRHFCFEMNKIISMADIVFIKVAPASKRKRSNCKNTDQKC